MFHTMTSRCPSLLMSCKRLVRVFASPKLTGMAGLSALLLVAVGVIVCSTNAAASEWALPANQPYDPNGTLRIGHGGPSVTLDPHMATQTGDSSYTFLVFDRLLRLDKNNKPEPMLATSWSFAPDGTYIDLQLRQDVTFHDGTRFDAAAVKANIERAKTVSRSTVAPLLSAVQSVEVLDPFKVRLHLVPHQGGTVPYILATNAGSMISPKALADPSRNLALDPGDAGSGPYIVTKYTPNESAFLERAGTPTWDVGAGLARSIEMIFYPTNAERLRALQTGALDFGQILGPEVLAARDMVKKGGFQAFENFGTAQALFLRSTRPGLGDERVRTAIFSAIDRAALAQAVFGGTCPAATQPFSADNWAHDPNFVDFRFNPDQARAELKAAGAGNVHFSIVVPGGSQYEQEAVVVQSQLKDIGVNVTVLPMQTGDAILAFREGRADALLYNITAQAHPQFVFDLYYTGGYAVTPPADLADTRALMLQALDPAATQDQQAKLYWQVVAKLSQQATALPICYSTQLWTSSVKVLNTGNIPKVGTDRDFRFLAVSAK